MASHESNTNIESLLDECLRPLVLYARQWCAKEAEDLVQEAFLRLLKETVFPDAPRAWLFRVVRNLAIDRTRREKRNVSENDIGPWFEPVAKNNDTFDDLTEALQQQPPVIREIIVLKIWGSLTFREIAELTGRPISSVHHDYQIGIEQLRTLLQDDKHE